MRRGILRAKQDWPHWKDECLRSRWPEFLYSLPSGQLARVYRAVYESMTIRASGYGRQRQAKILAYQLTPAPKVALMDRVHIESIRPLSEGGWTGNLPLSTEGSDAGLRA